MKTILSVIIASILSIGAFSQTLDSALVGYWGFNESSGNIATDQSGNGLNGNIIGCNRASGILGYSMVFNGINNYIDFGKNAIDSIGKLETGTISIWFKFEDNLSTNLIQPILYMGIDDTLKDDNLFIIEIGHSMSINKKLYITWVFNGGLPILCFDSKINLNPDQWYNFIAVIGKNFNTGYLDGVEMVNRFYNFGDSSMRKFFKDVPSKDILTLGYGKTGAKMTPHFDYFKGQIDEFRLYNKALNAEEALSLYEKTLSISNEKKQINTLLYPNPAFDFITLKDNSLAKGQSIQVFVTNTNGQIVLNKNLISDTFFVEIDVSELPSGLYFINIYNKCSGNRIIQKIFSKI